MIPRRFIDRAGLGGLVLLLAQPFAAGDKRRAEVNSAPTQAQTAAAAGLPPAQEEVVAEIPQDVKMFALRAVALPDGGVAWYEPERRGGVNFNNERGPEFEWISHPVFYWRADASGPGPVRVAYTAKRAKKKVLVVDNVVQPVEAEDFFFPTFSPDGRLAYALRPPGSKLWRYVVDGEPVGGEYPDVLRIFFSPDGKHSAFGARQKGNKWFVVLDGQERAEEVNGGVCRIGAFLWSADGAHFAYTASELKIGWFDHFLGTIVVDGKAGPSFQSDKFGTSQGIVCGLITEHRPWRHGVSWPVWRADGTGLAYAARRGKDDTVVFVDGEPGPKFEEIIAGPYYAPDGRLVYFGWEKNKIVEMAGGERVREFAAARGVNFLYELTFSGDARRRAYVVARGGAFFAMGNTGRARRRVVADGVDGKVYDAVDLDVLRFSADGRHLAYEVHDLGKGKSAVVVDGLEGPLYDEIVCGSLHFKDEKTVGYVARRERTFLRVTQPLP